MRLSFKPQLHSRCRAWNSTCRSPRSHPLVLFPDGDDDGECAWPCRLASCMILRWRPCSSSSLARCARPSARAQISSWRTSPMHARATSPISLRSSSAVYTCAPSDFYDSPGHASTDRMTWKPVCPRLELQPDDPRQRRRLQCWLRPLTVDEVLYGGQAGRQPVLGFLAGLATTQATRPRSSRRPGLRGPWREPPAVGDGAGGRRRQSSCPLSQVSAVISRGYLG